MYIAFTPVYIVNPVHNSSTVLFGNLGNNQKSSAFIFCNW